MKNLIIFDYFGDFASKYLSGSGNPSNDLVNSTNSHLHIIDDSTNVNFLEDVRYKLAILNNDVFFFIHVKAKGAEDIEILKKQIDERRKNITEIIIQEFNISINEKMIRPFSSETMRVKDLLEEECYNFNSFKLNKTFSNDSFKFLATDFKPIPKYKIFISHSSEDFNIIDIFVRTILKTAKIDRADVFLANRKNIRVPIGKSIPQEIKEKLDASKIFLSFISENYMNSPVCLMELGASYFSKPDNRRFKLVMPGCNFRSFFDKNIQNIDLSIDQALNKAFQNSGSEIYKALREIGCDYEADEMGTAIEEFKKSNLN